MKVEELRGSKVYWVAQNQGVVREMRVFRRREDAVHFIDHRVEGWSHGLNDGRGWLIFKCFAGSAQTAMYEGKPRTNAAQRGKEERT